MKLLSLTFLLLLSEVIGDNNSNSTSDDSFDVKVSSSYGIQGHSTSSNTTIVYPSNIQQIQERTSKKQTYHDQISQASGERPIYQVHEIESEDSEPSEQHFLPTPQAYTAYSPESIGDVNNNLDTNAAASFPRPSLPEIQNVLSSVNHNELDLNKIPKHSKILEIVRVPAVYELHLESDANRLVKLNPWTKNLMPQFALNGAFNEHQQQIYESSQDVPQYVSEIPLRVSGSKVQATYETKPSSSANYPGRSKQQYRPQPQHQEIISSYASRGKKKYQSASSPNSSAQQYLKNYPQQLTSATNNHQQYTSSKNNYKSNLGSQNEYSQQTKGHSSFPSHHSTKVYVPQSSSNLPQTLTGEVEYYQPPSSNYQNHQMAEEPQYTPNIPSTSFIKYPKPTYTTIRNVAPQVPSNNFGHHQEIYGASHPIPQYSDAHFKQHPYYNHKKSYKPRPTYKKPVTHEYEFDHGGAPSQDFIYEKPKAVSPNFEKYAYKQESKKIIPTYSHKSEQSVPVSYKSEQQYEQSSQNYQYSFPNTKKSVHESRYSPPWNSDASSEYLGESYRKPQAIHEVPAPIFNGNHKYINQNPTPDKIIYGKPSDQTHYISQAVEYESGPEYWQPEASKEVKYIQSPPSKQQNRSNYNKGIVDSVPNEYASTSPAPTESSSVRYETPSSVVYETANPKVNYNQNIYIEEVPANKDEVEIIFAQNPSSTETPHHVEVQENDIQQQQQDAQNYANVDFPQPFQANKNRRSSTPAPLPPPQINYVLLIKERNIDD